MSGQIKGIIYPVQDITGIRLDSMGLIRIKRDRKMMKRELKKNDEKGIKKNLKRELKKNLKRELKIIYSLK
jgi:hypothetical protein